MHLGPCGMYLTLQLVGLLLYMGDAVSEHIGGAEYVALRLHAQCFHICCEVIALSCDNAQLLLKLLDPKVWTANCWYRLSSGRLRHAAFRSAVLRRCQNSLHTCFDVSSPSRLSLSPACHKVDSCSSDTECLLSSSTGRRDASCPRLEG